MMGPQKELRGPLEPCLECNSVSLTLHFYPEYTALG
jgi:hypothetical protein